MWEYNFGDSSDYLEHRSHKYIKKERKNGKWRYYYNVGKPGVEIKKFDYNQNKWVLDKKANSSVQGFTKLQDIMGKDEAIKLQRAEERANRFNENDKTKNGYGIGNYEGATFKTQAEANKYLAKKQKTRQDVLNAYKAYSKTPLGKIYSVKTAIAKGRNVVANAMKKISSKIETKKKIQYW